MNGTRDLWMGPSLATTFPGEMPPAAPIAPLAYAGDPGIGDQGPESVRCTRIVHN